MQDVASERAQLRARLIGPRYRGWAHFAFTSLGSLSVVAFALTRLHGVRPAEWLTLPVAFLIANAAEYLGHKGPMHHRRPGLALVFRRHTLEHHRFFTDRAMSFEGTRDFKLVLFPPVMLLFFLGGIATPIALVARWTLGANVAWLFVAVGVGYFLTYEWLHFAYHLPPSHPVARVRWVAALARHHTVHHDPARMARFHFNITFPIFDRLLGTMAPGSVTLPPPATSGFSPDGKRTPAPENGNRRSGP